MSLDRHAAAILGWVLVLVGVALGASRALGLKYAQEIVWPTALYTFSQMPAEPIDVAVVGSSRASFGLSPSAIDACLEDGLGRPTHTVNLSRVYASMTTEAIVARDLLVDQRAPEIVVFEVAPEILNSLHHDRGLNFAWNAGLSDLGACLWAVPGIDRIGTCARPLVRGVENLAEHLSRQVRNDDHLSWMMLHHGGGQFCYGSPDCATHNLAYTERLKRRWGNRMRRTIPTLRQDRFSEVEIGSGLAMDYLREAITTAEERGSTVVLVNMPVHTVYQEQIPRQVIADFRRAVSTVDAAFYDANSPTWQQRRRERGRMWIDPDHLGPNGAKELSEQVCREVLLPRLDH